MCYQLLIGAGLQLLQGAKEQEAAEESAVVLGNQAGAEVGVSRVRAKKTREAGEATAGAARTDFAKANVNVDAGSAAQVQETIRRQVEEDALNEILYGRRRADAMSEQARLLRMGGKNALTGSVLSAGGTVARGWKRGGTTTRTRGGEPGYAGDSGFTDDGTVSIA